jgi:acetyl esterase/lipase
VTSSRGRRPVAASVLLAVVVVTGSLVASPDPAQPAEGIRFLDPVFDDVDVTTDLHYRTAPDEHGDPVDLALDIYEPAGDTARNRPLVLWMFGGGFVVGEKDGPLEQIMGENFASRGYVVASIDYRLSSSTTVPAILRAYEDARAALAWLRDHADEYGIDPERVVSSGMSAGAVTALNTGYLPDRSAGEGTDDDPSHVDAVLSFAGITIGAIETGEPAMFMAHGTADTTVPFAIAQQQCDTANAMGVECVLDPYAGYDHVGFLVNLPEILAKSLPWLHGQLALADWNPLPDDDAPPDTGSTDTGSTDDVVPPDGPRGSEDAVSGEVPSPTPVTPGALAARPVTGAPAFTG